MSRKVKVWLQTTDVPAMKSVGEIISEIVQRGATQIHQEFNGAGQVIGLSFLLTLKDGTQVPVKIPAQVQEMKTVLKNKILGRRSQLWHKPIALEDMAFRILWRQKLNWIRAMFADIDLDQTTPETVFLPYIQNMEGKSVAEVIIPRLQEFVGGMLALKGKD
jgi:hypothetical protein